jgi:hybrid polyketide synthase / nonribosomal peptide synthetase ACE1
VLARFLQSSLPEMARVGIKLVGDLLEDTQNHHIDLKRDQEGPLPSSALAALFSDAVASVRRSIQANSIQDCDKVKMISPGDYADNRQSTLSAGATAVIDWSSASGFPLTATARPLDSMRPLLRGDRTYLLLGLGGKGGLGSSLAEYLVRQGARYIILTSRNPGVDSQLTEAYARQGVRIQGFANDVTDEASLTKLVQDLRNSPDWPPIAGIANGAMVLADVSLQNMTHDQMVRVLRPKIDGSILVDKIFHSDPLDFFILFSSLSCVLGNRGQANYDAANMFLVGLAAQRRARGVVASVVDIGAIMGMGYMAREVKEQTLKQMVGAGFNKMSERDFFMAFAHGMLAGCSSSSTRSSYEVITGLHVPPPSDEFQPGWISNPRFSHMVARRRAAARQQTKNTSSAHQSESTRDLLNRSKTLADVCLVITAALLNKMTHMLQLGGEAADDQEALLLRGTSSLGVDSLVAVEIRSWMLREFEVDMPVFKILADTTIQNMVEFIVEAVPKNVTPCLDKDSNDNAINDAAITGPKTGDQGDSKPEQSAPPSYFGQHGEVLRARTASERGSLSNSSSALTRPVTAASKTADSWSFLESVSQPSSPDEKHQHKMLTRSSLDTDSSALGPLIRSEFQETAPMSYGQSRFWLMSELGAGSTACNVVNDIEIRAKLNKAALARAIHSLGARHEALRTAFVKRPVSVSEEANWEYPQQVVLKESPLKLEMIEVASAREVDELFQKLHSAAYNLETGNLMKMILVSVSPRLHHLLIGYHHINMDSFSMAILMKEMLQLYDGRELPIPRIQQANLALHERSQLQGGHWAKQMKFWREQFATKVPEPLPVLAISPGSSTRRRPERIAYRTHTHRTRLSSTTAQHVWSMCRGSGVTPFHLYAAVLQVLLTRLAPVERVIIGMADGNRGSLELPGATDAVGNFINIVPLPLDAPVEDESVHEVLRKMQATVIQAMSNSSVPFEIILEQARAPRSTSYSPLFQVFIDYKKVTEKLPFPGVGGEIEGKRYLLSKTPYDIILDVIDTPAGDALLELSAQDGLYTSEEAQKLLDYYVNLLNLISQSHSQKSIGGIDMFDAHGLENAMQLGQGKPIHLLAF